MLHDVIEGVHRHVEEYQLLKCTNVVSISKSVMSGKGQVGGLGKRWSYEGRQDGKRQSHEDGGREMRVTGFGLDLE